MKKRKENPAGCAGDDKQSKGNLGEDKWSAYSAKFEFCNEFTRTMCEGKGESGLGDVCLVREGEGRERVRGEREALKQVSQFLKQRQFVNFPGQCVLEN